MGAPQLYPAAGDEGGEPATAVRMEEIRAALEAFSDVQNKHIAAFTEGGWNDIMEWRAERERTFASLQMNLTSLPNGVREEGRANDELLVLLQSVLERERMLAGRVRERQAQLEQGLRTMRKGRMVLKGYNPTQGCPSPARFLNNRT